MANYTITITGVTGGSVTASKASAAAGKTITLTPSPNTGYQLSGYTTYPSVTIKSNKFTMPSSNIVIVPSFSKVNYTISFRGVTGGSVTANKATATYGETVTLTPSANTGYMLTGYSTNPSVTISNNQFSMPAANITIVPSFSKISYTITINQSTGGRLTADKSTATYGETVTLTSTPSEGYRMASFGEPAGVTVTNNKFTMPASNVTFNPTFSKIYYPITSSVSPAGAGTVTVKKGTSVVSVAQMGDTITLTRTVNSGYLFKNYEITPAVTLSSGSFTMPAKPVTITANYYKYSTATINNTTLTGGETRIVTINADKTSYSHTVQLRWDAHSKTDTAINVPAGEKYAQIIIPPAWASSIPNSLTGTGLTVRVKTYDGSAEIGTYDITGLTFRVSADAVPSVGTIGLNLVKPSNPSAYNSVSQTLFIQNYAKLNVQISSAAGKYGSTISQIKIAVSGYSGGSYNKTISGTSANWTTSDVLTKAGTCTVNVTVTDSRGRTASASNSVTVTAYNKPSGSLRVIRTDASGNQDDVGEYAKFYVTGRYTAIGNNGWSSGYPTIGDGTNTAQVTVSATETNGFLLPGNKKSYSIMSEYTITLTLKDKLVTTTITATLPSARFIIHTNKTGNNNRLAFMKAANKTIPSGKASTVEFSGDSQIYIGDYKLEEMFILKTEYDIYSYTVDQIKAMTLGDIYSLTVLEIENHT